jgi:hypothetical protein
MGGGGCKAADAVRQGKALRALSDFGSPLPRWIISTGHSVIENELLEFVRSSIRSVWNVELLLHLRRSDVRSWAMDELVRDLRASASVVRDGLQVLHTAGLVAKDEGGHWRYAPASPVFDRLTSELEILYRERPTAVTQALFARTDRLRSFADAFRLRKD